MLSYKKILVTCCLILSLLMSQLFVTSAMATNELQDDQNGPMEMTVDLIICRPLGLVATLAGTVVFVVSLPFSALGDNTGEAWDSLVATPAGYTFTRPLGEFD